MRHFLLAFALVFFALSRNEASAQVPVLPGGAQTRWVIEQPEEIVAYVVFDPATVIRNLPPSLRFIPLEELKTGNVQWAKDYLAKHPTHIHWGVSFFEIVRMHTFTIDGRAPDWPKNGAAALWCARVAPADSATSLGPGRPFLVLEFWMPDSSYVLYMRTKGHYATYGAVSLYRDKQHKWHGSVNVDGLSVVAECMPGGPVTGGPSSKGEQALYPPLSSKMTEVVRVAFAGHREQECEPSSFWKMEGAQPLAGGIVVGLPSCEYGYNLMGGACPR